MEMHTAYILRTVNYCAAPHASIIFCVCISSVVCLFKHHHCVIWLFYCTFLSLPFPTLTSFLHHIRLSHQLPLIAHSPSSSFLFPSPHLICQGYIIFVLLLLEHTPSTHNSPSPHSASQPIECHFWQGVWRRSGESWDYPAHLPGDKHTQRMCVFSVCVIGRISMCACACLCESVDLVFELLSGAFGC